MFYRLNARQALGRGQVIEATLALSYKKLRFCGSLLFPTVLTNHTMNFCQLARV